MARIRTVKPEFWTDEKVVSVSFPARLLFIGLWNYADDAGNLEYSPVQLKMRILPADAIEVIPLIEELKATVLLREYSVNNKNYLNIPNFLKHQKINNPSGPRVPPPPLPEPSEFNPLEGKGMEGNGEDTPPEVKQPETDEVYIQNVKDYHNNLPEETTDEWKRNYGDVVNVDAALFAATTWLIENPRNRKKNIRRFYGNWLRNQFTRATQPRPN